MTDMPPNFDDIPPPTDADAPAAMSAPPDVRPFVVHKPAAPKRHAKRRGLDPADLEPASKVIAEGQQIANDGIPYLVDEMIPGYGGLGMLVARAKVGKSTFSQQLAGAVAMGIPFLEKDTTQTRVLLIAAEDPPNYTAWLARNLTVSDPHLTFYRQPLSFTVDGLQALTETIHDDGYGFVVIASWQALVRGLLRDENDNATAVAIAEHVKAAARETNVPWLIDAHSGKGEDQDDDADPTLALRGASAAAGAADYLLNLRYANGAFGTQRRLSGKGRFVNLAPITLDYDAVTGAYTSLGPSKDAAKETTWRLIDEVGALKEDPQSLTDIARAIGLLADGERLGGNTRRHLSKVLAGRQEVGRTDVVRRGQKTTLYSLLAVG
jgi:AAA domain